MEGLCLHAFLCSGCSSVRVCTCVCASQMSNSTEYSMATADISRQRGARPGWRRPTLAPRPSSRRTGTRLTSWPRCSVEQETVDGEEFMSLFIDGKSKLHLA